jgi:uncharacterized protein YndB with AHSA1/START domain
VKIEIHADIAAPAEFVFRRLTDFARHERKALRGGAEVKRLDSGLEAALGATWEIDFTYRGKARKVRAEIVRWTPPEQVQINGQSGGLDTLSTVDVVPLSRSQTRVNVVIALMPRSMTARLLVQSLKLARGSVTARLDKRLAEMGAEIAAAWARKEA